MTNGQIGGTIPPILLVRLRPQQPNGVVVGETRRVCHLVPVPDSHEVPEALQAYCGAGIAPGTAELLSEMSGMPCEPCLARSPLPAFALLRGVPIESGHATVEGSHAGRDLAAWWNLGLLPEQRIAARFVLLLLVQDPARSRTVGEIAERLDVEPPTVNLILLLHAAVGWVQRTPDPAGPGWLHWGYRVNEHAITQVRRQIAAGMTATFLTLANQLDLDTTVLPKPGTQDLGGCRAPLDTTPTGHHSANPSAPDPRQER
jgi:predicted transcriptional regulator